MPDQPIKFGDALRTLRRDASLTQRELADQAGLDFSYVSKLENSRNPPPAADTILALCRIIGVEPEGLLALAGKLPSEVHEEIGANPAAQQFLREAQRLRLREDEWRQLGAQVRRMRGLKK